MSMTTTKAGLTCPLGTEGTEPTGHGSFRGPQKYFNLFLSFFLFCFLVPRLPHMEVPRLGVELQLQPPAHTTATAMQDLGHVCDLHHGSQPCWILTPLSEARD